MCSSDLPTFAVCSDINPGTYVVPTGGKAEINIQANDSATIKSYGNSPNHAQAGQEVLYADGHVDFESTPFCGYETDNIFTRGGAAFNAAVGPSMIDAPYTSGDTVMLPTYTD